MDDVQRKVDELYKSHFGKVVGSILRFSDSIDFETAEDIAQDSFATALIAWSKSGIPDYPEAWLFKVCKNKTLDKIRENGRVLRELPQKSLEPELFVKKSIFDDGQLSFLFACANPDLSPKTQVVITLKYVINLKVEAIAKILGMSIDGIDKLLVRARQKIREKRIFFEEPVFEQLKTRLHVVHKILYLVFNEGYKTSWGRELIREELCEDALIMARALAQSRISNGASFALYSLMLFNASRFQARFGKQGELLDLEEQDRTLWNRDLIRLGIANLKLSEGRNISSYHYEASIARLHCRAGRFADTDWNTISMLYGHLLKTEPNPFVELNFAIALYFNGQNKKAIDILQRLEQEPFLSRYYLLYAALGRIWLMEGNHALARKYLEETLGITNSPAEQDFIRRLLKKATRL
ncbi:MAG TPA: sigma-70 family RNA polymerase sigma factor [Puia sp.]|nr:sigma-70 family RNA polymerase sigma factor [Puia sp.]